MAAHGLYVLEKALSAPAPSWLREVPALRTLWRVWLQNFSWAEDEKTLRLRTSEEIPPGRLFIGSPYDEEARFRGAKSAITNGQRQLGFSTSNSQKRPSSWVGYKVHLTEACEEALPFIITPVEFCSSPLDRASIRLCLLR
jgi:transposase